jgi:hypothetical protein
MQAFSEPDCFFPFPLSPPKKKDGQIRLFVLVGGLPFPASGSPSAKKMQAFSEPDCFFPFPLSPPKKKDGS